VSVIFRNLASLAPARHQAELAEVVLLSQQLQHRIETVIASVQAEDLAAGADYMGVCTHPVGEAPHTSRRVALIASVVKDKLAKTK